MWAKIVSHPRTLPRSSFRYLAHGYRPARWVIKPSQVWRRLINTAGRAHRPAAVLDEWVQKAVRPVSLRQLTFFGRVLTKDRLLRNANYVREELPIRIAHRIRDMQTLPYVVLTNAHLSYVYDLYYSAFEKFSKIKEIKSVEENDHFCAVIRTMLQEHLTVIPRLAMGVIECQSMLSGEKMDTFVNTLLRARISRRVIAEQHLALTDTFHSCWHFPDAKMHRDEAVDAIGDVFLRCNASQIVTECADRIKHLAKVTYGPATILPSVSLEGHLEATFPYILSHLQYIVGELLRNSVQALVETAASDGTAPPPIHVLISESPQHVIIRISDQGGGISQEEMKTLFAFSKSRRSKVRLENFSQVPKMSATMQELQTVQRTSAVTTTERGSHAPGDSLSSLTSRSPSLRLGMGLPMSRVYAQYWAGSLNIHSLEGYGCDAFLQISKFGNKNEQLSTRASVDAI